MAAEMWRRKLRSVNLHSFQVLQGCFSQEQVITSIIKCEQGYRQTKLDFNWAFTFNVILLYYGTVPCSAGPVALWLQKAHQVQTCYKSGRTTATLESGM